MTSYTMHLADATLLEFDAAYSEGIEASLKVSITWADDSQLTRLPFPLAPEPTDAALASWIERRTIPKNRQFAQQLLYQAGLNENDILGIINLCKALSVNDAFWVERQGEGLSFDDINLFDNPLDETLAIVAYTGYTSSEKHNIGLSSEWTTDGQFPKAWRHTDRGLELWKGGTDGAVNLGKEPYSEFMASQLARKIGVNAVDYRLERWKGKLASVCPLMNSKNVSFVPFYAATGKASFPVMLAAARAISDEECQFMRTMFVFDALIANRDRHANNHGFLRDNATGRLLGPAPLFDHNMSLFARDMKEDWESGKWNPDILDGLSPANYRGSYTRQLSYVMGPQQHDMLRKALDVHIDEDSAYPMEPGRNDAINRYIHDAARKLLSIPVVDEDELNKTLDTVAEEALADNPAVANEAKLRQQEA